MTGKFFELLLSLNAILDQFIQTISDAVIFGNGIGDGSLGIFKSLVGIILLALTAAFIWHVYWAVVNLANETKTAMHNVRKALFALMCGALMMSARSSFYGDPMNGSWMGLNYKSVVQGISESTMSKAMDTLASVDVVQAWLSCLAEGDAARQEKILQAISAKDPETYQAYLDRLVYVQSGGRVYMGTAWGALVSAKDQLKRIFNGDAWLFLFRLSVNGFIRAFIGLGVAIAELMFVVMAGRTIVIFAFYVKLATILTLLVIPPALGLMYFEGVVRDLAVRVTKQIVVLMLIAGTMASAVQVVFDQDNIKLAMSLAMESEVGPLDSPVTDADIQAFESRVDMETTMLPLMGGDNLVTQYFGNQGTMTVKDAWKQALAMMKMMVILGIMLSILAQLYELFSGLLEGKWDPLAHGSKASGGGS